MAVGAYVYEYCHKGHHTMEILRGIAEIVWNKEGSQRLCKRVAGSISKFALLTQESHDASSNVSSM